MKAMRLNNWGAALEMEELPIPEPGEDEVLIRIRAASINPFDSAIQAGYLQEMAQTPLTMGTDFAGDVVSVGKNISHLKPDDAVYGLSPLGSGAFADYMTVKAHEVALKPQSLDYVNSAGVPLPVTAAWITLYQQLKIKEGERILIIGAAGNVGSLATQLSKAEGLFVYGTDIMEKAEHGKEMGIDRFIPAEESFEEVAEEVDVVLDLVGGEYTERSYNLLDPGGRYCTSLEMEPDQAEPQRRGIISTGLAAWPNAEVLAEIARRIDAGKLKVTVNRTFPLEEANAAMAYRLETREPGKVVLEV